MMLAALKLTLSPLMEPASWAAISSQWSARADEAANSVSNASVATSNVDRRNCRRDVMCEGPFCAIEACAAGSCKSQPPCQPPGNQSEARSAAVTGLCGSASATISTDVQIPHELGACRQLANGGRRKQTNAFDRFADRVSRDLKQSFVLKDSVGVLVIIPRLAAILKVDHHINQARIEFICSHE